MTDKIKLATASLAGCFGCHMSFLDIDERILELVDLVEFERSPFTDIKTMDDCDVGLIEGGVANEENVAVLKDFRSHCRILVAVGACAIDGGIPSLRNRFSVKECLMESYVDGIGVEDPHIPDDPEIPMLLNKVHPIQEVVNVDYFLPGCPPSADTIWSFITKLVGGGPVGLSRDLIRYD